jgi:hypothetical protein
MNSVNRTINYHNLPPAASIADLGFTFHFLVLVLHFHFLKVVTNINNLWKLGVMSFSIV